MDAKVAPSTEEQKQPPASPTTGDASKTGMEGVVDDPAANKPKVSRKNKNYYLLMAQVEAYADDSELYKPRITREVRMDYWSKMLSQRSRRENTSMTYQEAWMKGEYDTEGPTYPSFFVFWLSIIKTPLWDYLYLTLFLLYLLLNIAVYDGIGVGLVAAVATNSTLGLQGGAEFKGNWSPEVTENAAAIGLNSFIVILPVVFMLLVQTPPSVGMLYFVTRCNDLVKYKARTTNFGTWAFSSIFIAQAVEYFFYGGADNVAAAGKCAYGEKSMIFFGQKEVVLGDLDAMYAREEASDDDEDFVDDPYPEGHETIDQRIARAREELKEDPENPAKQALVKGELEISFLQKILKDKSDNEHADARRIKEEELLKEATCTEWSEWTCVVCNRPNRRPRHPPSVSDVFFGSKGIFYKRTFAIIVPRRDKAMCNYCQTYMDYIPPLSSAHVFPYNKAPYRAFARYPINVQVQAGLKDTPFARFLNSAYSLVFGLRNNSASLLVYNDWRLRLYLKGRFPETPRQRKKKEDLYHVGEFVECKLQKSDWQRCQVIKSRKNHTYDLRYDPGDELRLVNEHEIRMMPEKRSYAYIVELMVIYLIISFPVGLLASQAISPGLITFFPFCAAAALVFLRVQKFVFYVRSFKFAGFVPILKLALFYTIPLIFMAIASAGPMIGTDWITVSYYWVGAKAVSLPVLYVMKPHFAVFALVLFLQTSAGMFLMAHWLEEQPVSKLMAVNLGPFLTATLTLIYYRLRLATYIDVGMVIRPPLNFVKPESLCLRLYHMIVPDPKKAEIDAEVAAEMAAAEASMAAADAL